MTNWDPFDLKFLELPTIRSRTRNLHFKSLSSSTSRTRVWEMRCVCTNERTKPTQLDGEDWLEVWLGHLALARYPARYSYSMAIYRERMREGEGGDVYELYPKWLGTRFKAHGTNVRQTANGRQQSQMGRQTDRWIDGQLAHDYRLSLW